MFIVDYSKDYYGNRIETETFNVSSTVIEFVSDKSQDENFKVRRINKYEGGKLYPHELEIQNGRIVLTKIPLGIEEPRNIGSEGS